MRDVEKIVCCAVHCDDGLRHKNQPINISRGYVVSGLCHHNCFTTLEILKSNVKNISQGFLTSKNRYVNRSEASCIATSARQIDFRVSSLFSEDLY